MRLKISKTALEKAVDYLAVQDYSVQQINKKLTRCGYETEEINNAIAKLLARGYLNDEKLCGRYWQMYLREAKCSIMQIKSKMLTKGFTMKLIDAHMPEGLTDYEKNTAYHIWCRRFKKDTDVTKFKQYLYRKGFSSSSISYAADKYAQSEFI